MAARRWSLDDGPTRVTIADYIERDLEYRIRTGADVPARLTLDALAATYGVSVTPVRTALDGLVRRGIIERLATGRLRIGSTRPRGKGPCSPAAPVDWDDVIGREVLTMALDLPPTDAALFVHEEALCERFGIGRTLLRRVLHGLSGGALVQHIPRRGWRVSAFSHDDCMAFIDVRANLELQALDLARPHLDPGELDRMIEGNGPAAIRARTLDNDLHGYFVERSGNRYIASFFDAHGRDYRRLFDAAAVGADVVREMAESHVCILEHARARRWARARTELRHHIEAQGPVMRTMIDVLRSAEAPHAVPPHAVPPHAVTPHADTQLPHKQFPQKKAAR